MAFSDPQSVTISTVANSLPRVSTNGGSSTYMKSDGNRTLKISGMNTGDRRRYQIRLDDRKIAGDPMVTGNNLAFSMGAYLVIDVPRIGYTPSEADAIVQGLVGWLTSANVQKVVAGEN